MRIPLLLLFALVVALPASAQPTRRGLAVEVKRTDEYQTVGGIYGVASVYMGSTYDWRALYNGDRIGEAEFYRRAGNTQLANRVARTNRRGKRLFAVGTALALTGVAVWLTSPEPGTILTEMENGDQNVQGGIGAGVAFVGALIGIKGQTMYQGNQTSAQQALDAIYGRSSGY